MKQVMVWAVALVAAVAEAQVTVKSPNGDIAAFVAPDASGRLTLQVRLEKKEVVPPSPLGITVDGHDFGKDVTFGEPQTRKFRETYAVMGLHDTAINNFREASVPLLAKNGSEVAQLELRVFDDGVAYRYRVPGKGIRTIAGEASAWVLPAGATVWYQKNVGCHEDIYLEQGIDAVPNATVMGVPVTVMLADKSAYLMLTEANLVGYSDLAVKAAGNKTLAAFFYADTAGWPIDGRIVSPWRVTLVAKDLNTLVNSDIVKNLCPPPSEKLAETTFYKPGRAV